MNVLSEDEVKFFKLAVGEDRIKKESPTEIIARCPICGDSRKSQNRARLHLYNANDATFVNCFNGDCPVHNKNMFSFLKQFYPNLYDKFIYNYKRKKLLSLNSDLFSKVKIEKESPKLPNIVYQDFSEYFIPLEKSPALEYFESRGFKYKNSMKLYYSNNVLKIGDKEFNLKNSLIIPLYTPDFKWYGFYSRNISEKKFSSYINPENNSYKVWNFFNVDKSKPVYIFEGIFDALSAIECGLTNCVACMGATPPDARLKELSEPIFCLDNDKTGLMNMQKYARTGFKVCLLNESEKDCNEMLKNGKNVKEIILSNLYEGPLAEVKIAQMLS